MRQSQWLIALMATSALSLASAPARSQTTAGATGGTATSVVPEIVVTAERRESSVQRTPQMIQAVTGSDLQAQHIVNATDLQTISPNLHFTNTGEQTNIFIRGAGSDVSTQRGDPSASFTVDGVAIVRPVGINGAFYDLDRVEILEGPQGTLYGRNSTAGAINIISHKPVIGQYSGEVDVTAGNYNLLQATGVVNVPISDTFAARLAVQSDKHDGYLTSGADDQDSIAVRLGLLWKPNDKLSVLTTAAFFRDTGQGEGDVPLKSASGSFLKPSNYWYVPEGPTNYSTTIPLNSSRQNLNITTVGTQIQYDLGPVTATVIPGYVGTQYNAITYQAGFPQHYDTPDQQESLEGRLSSNGNGPFKWVGGIFLLKDHQNGVSDASTSPNVYNRTFFNELDLTSYAAFGQASYAILPNFRLIGGLRYTHDNKTMDGDLLSVDGNFQPTTPSIHIFGNQNYSAITYKAGVEYDVAPNHLLYANTSTGYTSGGFNGGTPPNTYLPENITAYTIGSKNAFFGRRIVVNIEAWHWDYKNVQEYQFGLANPGQLSLITYNAADLISQGVEAQTEFAIGDHGRLTVSGSYTDAHFSNFILPAFKFGPFNIPQTNFTGHPSNDAPRWSGVVGYTHRFPLPNGGVLIGSGTSQLQTSEYITLNPVIGTLRGGSTHSNLNLTYQEPGHRWELELWAKNLENTPEWAWGGDGPAGLWGDPGAPRTFGVSARSHF